MDLNSLLCVGRADMYRSMNDNHSQHFLPVVSSFKMDSLRGSVRKDKPDSRSSSRRSSNSPGSPSKSILRGQILDPNQGSPNGNRNVRFRDGRSHGDTGDAFSRLHVNETTQTNGNDNISRTNERVVQVYSSSDQDPRAKRNAFSNMVDERFNALPISSSTPRSARDRSPTHQHGSARERSPTNQPGYLGSSNHILKQRELPQTPFYMMENRGNNQGVGASRNNQHDNMGIRKDRSPYRTGSSNSKRPSLATQTPKAPSGQKIVQNMGVNEYVRTPKGVDVLDGRRIIQNMEFDHRPKEKSIGVGTQDFECIEYEKSVGIQTQDEEDDFSKEIGIQTLSDIETQTPRDVGVQTPRDVEVQTIDDMSLLASDDEDYETHMDAFSQTYSDEEFGCRDVEVQTPRDIGVQTPRTVSIQTSDTSDEEETTSVAVQTSDITDDKRIVPNLDIHTSIWSNTRPDEDSFELSSSDEDSELHQKSSSQLSNNFLPEESDDEEVYLPPYLTEPFPKKQSVYSYNKPTRTSSDYSRGFGSSVASSGTLIDHSARQLLERETLSTSRSNESRLSKSTGSSSCFPPSTSRPFISKRSGPSTSTISNQWQGKHGESISRIFQAPDETAEAGTQFQSDYHLELQKQEDRIKELSESLEFTPIETHSFDTGSKRKADKQAPRVESKSARDSLTKNALIKDVNFGPLPRPLDNNLRDVSPSRQRLVKSVDFKDTPLDRYSGTPGSDYIFFKKTALGSEYDTFQPKQQQSIMKPYRSYSSPPRPSVTKPRPSSSPAVPRQHYTSNSSHLTPTLSHLRKQAIRKSVTDTTRTVPRSQQGSSSNCQRSDTFISSTKPPPQPLTLPLSKALPSYFPDSPSPDAGTYESLGNQPRFLSNLKDLSNCRPEPKEKKYTAGMRQKPAEGNNYHTDYWSNRKSKVTEVGNKKGFSTSSKPPIPRGRNPERKKRQASAKSARDTILSSSTDRNKPRSRSADNTSVTRSTQSNGQNKTRDQGTATGKRYRSVSHDKDPKRVTIGKSRGGNKDSGFLGNDTIQRIIEKSSW